MVLSPQSMVTDVTVDETIGARLHPFAPSTSKPNLFVGDTVTVSPFMSPPMVTTKALVGDFAACSLFPSSSSSFSDDDDDGFADLTLSTTGNVCGCPYATCKAPRASRAPAACLYGECTEPDATGVSTMTAWKVLGRLSVFASASRMLGKLLFHFPRGSVLSCLPNGWIADDHGCAADTEFSLRMEKDGERHRGGEFRERERCASY